MERNKKGPKQFRDMRGEFGPKIVPTLNLNLTHEGQKIMQKTRGNVLIKEILCKKKKKR